MATDVSDLCESVVCVLCALIRMALMYVPVDFGSKADCYVDVKIENVTQTTTTQWDDRTPHWWVLPWAPCLNRTSRLLTIELIDLPLSRVPSVCL